jgi:O-succinylbenzoic acid--CoA ligase
MPSWLHAAQAKHPDRPAIEFGGGAVSYAELFLAAMRAAAALDDMAADRVGLAIADRSEFAVALHACLLLGKPAVPIDLRLSVEEQAVRAARADLVLTRLPTSSGDLVSRQSLGPADGVATVMHTSGTTAAPKPVELTSANWEANAAGSAAALGLDPAERWLCVMPLTHVGGLSILIRSVIYATTVVLHDRFETDAVLRALSDPDERITIVSLVPTMLARLLDAGLREPPALRWALLGGGPIAPALLERAAEAGVPVAPTYGMTEACSQIATFGYPLPGVEYILDGPEREIRVRGPIVAPAAVDEQGWLNTGDLGDTDEGGHLVIVGRKADTIVTGGENVAPAEVEAALLEHPAVADAAVLGRPDPEWGEMVVAQVVLRDDVVADAHDLREHCAARLAPFKVPKRYEVVTRVPRGVTGKLLRRELR